MRWMLVCALCACVVGPVAAGPLELVDVYDAALEEDARYRAAAAERDAAAQAVAIARAALLPRADFGYSLRRLDGTRELIGARAGVPPSPLKVTSEQVIAQLRQPLFDVAALLAYRGARAEDAGAASAGDERRNEITRLVVRAYLDLVVADTEVARLRRERRSYRQLLRIAEARVAAGEGTAGDVAEARAQVLVTDDSLQRAREERAVARRALALVTGIPHPRVPAFASTLPPLADDRRLADWRAEALLRSPLLEAHRQKVAAAEWKLKQARAGHLPTVDAVAGWNSAASESLATLEQRSDYYSAGIQIDVPLFAGGALLARGRQAGAERDAATYALEAARDERLLDVERNYREMRNARRAVGAMAEVSVARLEAEHAVEQAYRAGEAALIDVIEASQRREDAEFRTLGARARVVNAVAELVAVTRIIERGDLLDFGGFFEPADAVPADAARAR